MSTRTLAATATQDSELRARAVLAERALALARPAEAEPAGQLVPLVVFSIGGVAHAVEAGFVREVLRRPPLSTVPLAPAALVGVAGVRGEILAVADISALIGVGAPKVPGPVIVLEGPGPSLGLLVDEVHDFVEVPADSIAPRPPHDKLADSSTDSLLLGLIPTATVLSGISLLTDPRLSTTNETRSAR